MKAALIRNGIATQNEVPALALRLLRKYPQIAKALAHRFPVILVDEAQDTSCEQMELIEIIADAGAKTVVLVGDPDQAIYEWRDATPEFFMDRMNGDIWQTHHLTANFRSSQCICNATAVFSSRFSGIHPATAVGKDADNRKKPILLQFSKDKTMDDIVARFKALCAESNIPYNPQSVAILRRPRIYSDTYIDNLWQTMETKWLAAATYQWYKGSKKEAFTLCEKTLYNLLIGNAQEISHEEMKLEIEKHVEYPSWRHNVTRLLKDLPAHTLPLSEWKTSIAEAVNNRIKAGDFDIRDSRAKSEIIRVKSRVKIRKNYSKEFLERPVYEFFEKRASYEVTFSSVHGVKGETFEAVLLLIMNNREKLKSSVLLSGDLNNEEIRIAYVVMSRPRKLLVVALPKLTASADMTRFPTSFWDYQEL